MSIGGYVPRLTLEVVVSEPRENIKKIVIKWEGYAADEEGQGYAQCKGYMYNWSNGGHRLLFKCWLPKDQTLRFILTRGFGSYINDEGRMRFVIVAGAKELMAGLPWLCTDFFEVTVCYED